MLYFKKRSQLFDNLVNHADSENPLQEGGDPFEADGEVDPDQARKIYLEKQFQKSKQEAK